MKNIIFGSGCVVIDGITYREVDQLASNEHAHWKEFNWSRMSSITCSMRRNDSMTI